MYWFYMGAKRNDAMWELCPVTAALLDSVTELMHCKLGDVKFSLLQPGTHIRFHTGTSNARIRLHLGLVTPPGAALTADDETHGWHEGEFFAFDDSFEHEVWHNGTQQRLVFIIDVWHPDLSQEKREELRQTHLHQLVDE
eukprot:TRINITY_DN2798_c0_g1_i2.p3 TRINITY_DN2798_c0_g1~~TRINITY_DN2798_c0_g1_i2.p3  ORF type:complete len:140 (-),score=29.47 TRINITY_DN2798_c0_g1_i2:34-453(-)